MCMNSMVVNVIHDVYVQKCYVQGVSDTIMQSYVIDPKETSFPL